MCNTKVLQFTLKISLSLYVPLFYLQFHLDSITHLLSLLDKLKNLSGLKINTKKTEGM